MAEFYPTVKAALHHESVDSEEDRKGLGLDLDHIQNSAMTNLNASDCSLHS